MKFSVALPIASPDELMTCALAIEEAGFDACFVTDHPFPSRTWLTTGGHETLDPFVALSFAAAATRRLRLHTNCLIPAYRNPYVAAKAGLNGLTRAIAVEEAKHGIRCNTISPGYVLNERRDADLAPDRRAALEGMHLTRLGEATDVADACVYLASRASGFVTGVNLQLDGGSSIARGRTLG